MRPLKLIITGFCSYGKRTEINLETLGNSGLYLITGKTGSGKTTIFDAITYALYGEPSGNNRETSMLRSNFAGPDLPTEVELFFELRGQKYHIKRNPSYERISKRGEGITVESAGALLELPDGKLLEGPKSVDKKIIELLGIDRKQFSQIVMLAQGDFQKLLTEETTARQEIFRKLFKTDNYQKLQKRLTEKQKELNIQTAEISRDLNLFFQNTQCDYDSVNSLELAKAKETEIPWADKLKLIEKIILEDKDKQTALEKQEAEIKNSLEKVMLELKDAVEIKNTREALSLKKDNIEAEKINVEKCRLNLEEAVKKLEENPEKERKAALISNDLEKYDQAENLKTQIQNLKNAVTEAKKQIGIYEEKIAEQNNQILNVNNELKELETAGDISAKLAVEQTQLDGKSQNIKELQNKLTEYSVILQDLEKAQNEYSKESAEAQGLQQSYLEKNKLFLDGQAGILAENLQENEPCPVCGSIHHPSLAKKQSFVPSQKELEEFKTNADAQSKLAEEKSLAASSLKGNAQNQLAELEKNKAVLFPEVSIENLAKEAEKALKEISLELNNLDIKIQENEKRKERKKFLGEKLPVLQEELNSLNEKLNLKVTELSVNETSAKHFAQQLEEALKKLQFAGKTEALAEIKKLEGEIAAVKQAHENANNNFHDTEMKLKELEGAAQELEERLKNSKDINEELLESEKVKLEEKSSDISNSLKQIFARITANQTAVEKIKPFSKELIEKQNLLQITAELANTAVGNLGQKKAKIMLETYVQMHYFDRIIAHANKRFMIMSGGQYELVRKKQADNAQSQTGLELNVIDHYKGKERDVKSLSGGESFEASLSLALGLSDEISESAGGIRIDSMFVDEGFGTLDSDTLQKAYNALVSVTEGNRLVGIISHVDFLKEKIDRQVVISKEPESGSSVTIKI